jgi:hypothetical protein
MPKTEDERHAPKTKEGRCTPKKEPASSSRKKWWGLQLQAMACGLEDPGNASRQYLLEQASFNEIQPLADDRAVW